MSDPCREAFEKQFDDVSVVVGGLSEVDKELRWSWWQLAWDQRPVAEVASMEELKALLRSADKGYWTGEMLARELHAYLSAMAPKESDHE